jgi:hypothetical protein
VARQSRKVFLHIGAMKTGTSYLQEILRQHKAALADDGILFPGANGWSDQVLATKEILNLHVSPEIAHRADGAWDRLRDEILHHDGRASVVSMEFMSFARRELASKVANSLKSTEVHVILTVRDASRVIPAQWQESTQNRDVASWQEYASAVLAGEDRDNPAWRAFQRALNIPRILRAWSKAVPPERLHVVLVPSPGSSPDQLWQRFASVIDIDPERFPPVQGARNVSLGYPSADLMRRVNAHLTDLEQSTYGRTVKRHLCKRILAARVDEPKMSMNRQLGEFSLDWNRTMADSIARHRCQVIGELTDLDVAPTTVETLDPPEPKQVLEAAADAVNGMQKLVEQRAVRLTPEIEAHRPVTPTHWNGAPEPIDAAVADIVGLIRDAVELRRRRQRIGGR